MWRVRVDWLYHARHRFNKTVEPYALNKESLARKTASVHRGGREESRAQPGVAPAPRCRRRSVPKPRRPHAASVSVQNSDAGARVCRVGRCHGLYIASSGGNAAWLGERAACYAIASRAHGSAYFVATAVPLAAGSVGASQGQPPSHALRQRCEPMPERRPRLLLDVVSQSTATPPKRERTRCVHYAMPLSRPHWSQDALSQEQHEALAAYELGRNRRREVANHKL